MYFFGPCNYVYWSKCISQGSTDARPLGNREKCILRNWLLWSRGLESLKFAGQSDSLEIQAVTCQFWGRIPSSRNLYYGSEGTHPITGNNNRSAKVCFIKFYEKWNENAISKSTGRITQYLIPWSNLSKECCKAWMNCIFAKSLTWDKNFRCQHNRMQKYVSTG